MYINHCICIYIVFSVLHVYIYIDMYCGCCCYSLQQEAALEVMALEASIANVATDFVPSRLIVSGFS